jgi:sulfate adenylyltransferase
MLEPHGGRLVDRVLRDRSVSDASRKLEDSPSITLTPPQFQEAVSIATGRLSPLEGFLNKNDFLKVVHDMTLEDGTTWPLPVVLDVDGEAASEIVPGERVRLDRPDGTPVGYIDAEEVYKHNKTETVKHVFGTDDDTHPGVRNYLNRDDFLVGGPITLFSEVRHGDYDLFPKETRVLFNHRNWDSVVGFQTRNAPHRAHEYIQKSALEQVDGLLVQPKIGAKKAGDYTDRTIIDAYGALMEHYYPRENVSLSVFPSKMRYAGPREAIFDALVRKNQGCTHFVVGRDHAGVKDFYDGFDAHTIFDEIDDIGIEPLFYNYSFYCTVCDGMVSQKICPHSDDEQIHPSGSKIREMIRSGTHPSEKMMRPEVADVIMDTEQPFVIADDGEEST